MRTCRADEAATLRAAPTALPPRAARGAGSCVGASMASATAPMDSDSDATAFDLGLRLVALARCTPQPLTDAQRQQLSELHFVLRSKGANQSQRASESCCRWKWNSPLPFSRLLELLLSCDRLRSTTPLQLYGGVFGAERRAARVPLLAALMGDEIPGLAQLAPAFPDSRIPAVRLDACLFAASCLFPQGCSLEADWRIAASPQRRELFHLHTLSLCICTMWLKRAISE